MRASLSECVSFQSEIEIEGGGAGSDFLTDDELSVEYAEIHFQINRILNVKAGALLVPFGWLNTHHDAPLLQLTDRPLMHDDLVPSTWTEAGIGAFGAFDVGPVTWDYDVILCNGFNANFDPVKGGGFEPVRASFREPFDEPIFGGSALYRGAHVQIAVRDESLIEEAWLECGSV